MCSKLDSSTEVGQIWPVQKMVMNVLFYEEGSEIGKNKSPRTVHNALRWLDRLAGLGRIGQLDELRKQQLRKQFGQQPRTNKIK
jgi:hypothetical protein